MGVQSAVGQGMHDPATLQPLRRQIESSASLEHHSIVSKNLCPLPSPPQFESKRWLSSAPLSPASGRALLQ